MSDTSEPSRLTPPDAAAKRKEQIMPELVAFIDGRCDCARCERGSSSVYRMIGRCRNCGADPILMLFRAGDPSKPRNCPLCGNYYAVEPYRRATDDEIPAAVQR